MSKQKYYVVWVGKQPGIYPTWEACKEQVHGVQGARYKSYPTAVAAEEAFQAGAAASLAKSTANKAARKHVNKNTDYIVDSISVDAACSGNPGDMEYQGVYTADSKEIFHFGPVPNGTNNIGEFLAIVHALALLKEKGSDLPIYSDSTIAIGWVQRQKANTTIPQDESTEELWDLIHRAEKWLKEHTYTNAILKWETKQWGESKADFGRK